VSAVTGEGVEALGERIELEFEKTLRSVDLLLPFDEGGRLAELHDIAGELERSDTAEGVLDRLKSLDVAAGPDLTKSEASE